MSTPGPTGSSSTAMLTTIRKIFSSTRTNTSQLRGSTGKFSERKTPIRLRCSLGSTILTRVWLPWRSVPTGVLRCPGLTGRWLTWTEASCTAATCRKQLPPSLRLALSDWGAPACCRALTPPSPRQQQRLCQPTCAGSTWSDWRGNILPSFYKTTHSYSPLQRRLTARDI